MIAEVIINSKAKQLNRTFDYNIPKEMEELILIGSKVLVPFGKMKTLEEAHVVKIKEKSQYEIKDIAKVEIPLPSIEKQHELSELFVETQKKYKELLEESEKQKSYAKQLRQNILQEAIEGKLTEEWRKENPVVKGNPDFDAEALFEKIQEEKSHTDSELLT